MLVADDAATLSQITKLYITEPRDDERKKAYPEIPKLVGSAFSPVVSLFFHALVCYCSETFYCICMEAKIGEIIA